MVQTIHKGWPENRYKVPPAVQPYWNVRSELAVLDGVVYRGVRITVPPTLQPHMLQLIYESHLGVVKCKQRAREVLYWPGMSV